MNHNILNKITENYIQNRIEEYHQNLYIGTIEWDGDGRGEINIIRSDSYENACIKFFDKHDDRYNLTYELRGIFCDSAIISKYLDDHKEKYREEFNHLKYLFVHEYEGQDAILNVYPYPSSIE